MKIEKVKGTYNTYKLEISYSQLQAFLEAMHSTNTPEPVSDETLAELEWYMNNIPGPGEDPEEFKQREEGGGMEGGQGGAAEPTGKQNEEPEDDSVPIPMPPREKGDYRETTAGEGPEEEEEGPPERGHRGGGGGGERGEERGPALPDFAEEEEAALPAPPRE